MNALFYALLVIWEQRLVSHHVASRRQLTTCRAARADARSALAEQAISMREVA